jgi:hypothetical protein
MFITSPILRAPKQSEMALSNQVKDSVHTATEALRDAMAFAARSEHPITIHTLSDILMRLESLECMDSIMERFGKETEGKESPFPFG